MTSNPDEAITDIRVAPYQGNGNINYGEIEYTFVGHVGFNSGTNNSSTAGDAILKTTDPNACSPIPADGIHFVTKHDDAEKGWEPVTLFCGLPYNFATKYDSVDLSDSLYIDNNDFVYSGFSSNKLKGIWDDHDDVYMYYEPTVQYTGGEKYLAGIYFINGYDVRRSVSTFTLKQTTTDMECLQSSIESYPYARIFERNLAKASAIKLADGHDNYLQYICYSYTYNPKRAMQHFFVSTSQASSCQPSKQARNKSVPDEFACAFSCFCRKIKTKKAGK